MICLTKSQTGKGMSQDCKKRNLVYETWCRTCETEALDMLRQENTTELDIQAKSKEIALYKYVGESGRSGFERCTWAMPAELNCRLLEFILECSTWRGA